MIIRISEAVIIPFLLSYLHSRMFLLLLCVVIKLFRFNILTRFLSGIGRELGLISSLSTYLDIYIYISSLSTYLDIYISSLSTYLDIYISSLSTYLEIYIECIHLPRYISWYFLFLWSESFVKTCIPVSRIFDNEYDIFILSRNVQKSSASRENKL